MKRNHIVKSILYSLAFGALFAACNNYDFDQEFYKNEIGLLSATEMMIYDRQVVDLAADQLEIAVVGNISGSTRLGKDAHFTIMPDDSLFHRYNKTNFDVDKERFAHMLPQECYEMESMSGVIKAGEGQGFIHIKLKNLEKLSPDSTYLLNFKLDPEASDPINQKKKHVLIKLFYKNDYASTKVNTSYTYRNTSVAVLSEGSSTARKISSSVRLFPIGANKVRMMAGDETWTEYKTALDDINAESIVLEVGEVDPSDDAARLVTIHPYKTIEVQQLPPIPGYNNTYSLIEDKLPGGRSEFYKEFRLHYKYRTSPDNPYKEVKANFRLRVEKYADRI